MKKQITIFIIFTLLIAIGIFGYIQGKTIPTKPNTPTPNPTPMAIFVPPQNLPQTSPVETIMFDGVLPAKTPTLPVYRATDMTITTVSARELGNTFSFGDTPTIASAGGSFYFTWGSTQKTWLSIKTTGRVVFKVEPQASGSGITKDPVPTALSYLQNKLPVAPPLAYKERDVFYYTSSPPTLSAVSERSKADVASVSFIYTLNNIPLFLTPLLSWDTSVMIKHDVFSEFSVQLPPKLTKHADVPLLSPKDALSALQNGMGILSRVEFPIRGEAGIEEVISSASLHDASLVYFYDKTTMMVRPAYLFVGDGVGKDGGVGKVYFLVSATEPF